MKATCIKWDTDGMNISLPSEIEIPEGAFEEYIKSRHKEKDITLEREDLPDGNVRFTVYTAEIKQRYSFTKF